MTRLSAVKNAPDMKRSRCCAFPQLATSSRSMVCHVFPCDIAQPVSRPSPSDANSTVMNSQHGPPKRVSPHSLLRLGPARQFPRQFPPWHFQKRILSSGAV